ncbi:MAG: choice-of-anchor U domain-containing protein [Burkholderiales bacterium]
MIRHGKSRVLPSECSLLFGAIVAVVSLDCAAAISVSERTALTNLYVSTNGASWSKNTNWNGAPGTECTWFGVGCDPTQSRVLRIVLSNNNLTGALPPLDGLVSLEILQVDRNRLTGAIPQLAGFPNLESLTAFDNQLTGPIPPVAGLSKLRQIAVQNNMLTGQIPSLSGTSMENLLLGNNQLTGPIPSLAGLNNLRQIFLYFNDLTGTLPPLASFSNLRVFDARRNRLTGAIPPLAGLNLLEDFEVNDNQLTGIIPSLTGLDSLRTFRVSNNQLTGPVPSLAGLSALQALRVDNNQLTGNLPAAPSPSALRAGGSALCPNYLTPAADPAWDTASGRTPWYATCSTPPATFSGPTATGSGVATATVVCTGTASCAFGRAAWISAPGTPGAPPVSGVVQGVGFPNGLLDFSIVGAAPGFVATLTLTFAQPLALGTLYYKFGPTPTDPSLHWYALPATVSGSSVSFSITDGGLGDDDLAANAVIDDVGGPASILATVIEYYHEGFSHYFITAKPDEIAKLDDGRFAGWQRTGLSFYSYARAFAGAAPVCRFFTTAFPPKSSHFYTPFDSECQKVLSDPKWTFEAVGDDVFHMPLGGSDGSCATGTVPVYRLFNGGQGGAPNHRYTTDKASRDAMLSKGWTLEGNGPGFAFMCSPGPVT